MERTCSEVNTLYALPPPLGTKLLFCVGWIFIQLFAASLTAADRRGETGNKRAITRSSADADKMLNHVCLYHGHA